MENGRSITLNILKFLTLKLQAQRRQEAVKWMQDRNFANTSYPCIINLLPHLHRPNDYPLKQGWFPQPREKKGKKKVKIKIYR